MKSQIINILGQTKRPGIENLINYLENESDFFKAPCSSQYHGCKEGGLAEHSLNVYQTMANLYNNIDTFVAGEGSIAIVSLLHDLGKSTYRGKPNYIQNILKSGKVSDSKPYETNPERLWIAHEIISLQIASKFIELTDEEEFAILYHNGLYTALGRDIQNGKERPLQLLLHFADMWCSRFVEKESQVNE